MIKKEKTNKTKKFFYSIRNNTDIVHIFQLLKINKHHLKDLLKDQILQVRNTLGTHHLILEEDFKFNFK